LGNLSTPKSVQKLQTALHAKAKAEAGYRFYALYDKIGRDGILAHAYAQCRSNKGAPGVDGQEFADIEAYGVQRWLGELALALRQETYRPDPIRRVFIPKANGKLRPLGISTLRDRVCMTAAMLVLEPIFEADLPPEQYAYRPGRNAQQAVVEVEALLFRGHPEVVDADLADYFGSIPHAELLKSVARRIVDRRVLHLIKMWLECPVEETDDRGRKTRTTEARDKRCGIPQGSPISPLLANLYMRRFVLGWKKLGLERSLGSRIVTYADDLVILCRKGKAEQALQRLREIMGKLKLTVNEDKTRICRVPEGEFDFLGYSFGRMYSARTGQARLGYRPSKKSIKRMVENIHALTVRTGTWQDTTELGQVEPHAARMGELLQRSHRHQSVPGARHLRSCAVAPVVAHQAQGQATQGRDLSTLAPLRALRARTPVPACARRAVGEGVKSCPRAGCGRSACPGSMSGMWKRSQG
jgi:group II intron reverse transcriptase/maturase